MYFLTVLGVTMDTFLLTSGCKPGKIIKVFTIFSLDKQQKKYFVTIELVSFSIKERVAQIVSKIVCCIYYKQAERAGIWNGLKSSLKNTGIFV